MDRRFRIDPLLVIPVLFVVFAGIFTLYTQEIVSDAPEGRWLRQLIFFAVGTVICLGLRRMNYQVIGAYAPHLFAIAILLLIITLIPGIGKEVKGARSWLRWGPVGFQTSEFAKLALIVLLAKYLEVKERDMEKIPTLLTAFAIGLLPMLLIVVQPDLGYAVAFAPIMLAMLFIAGADILHMLSIVIFFGVSMSIPLYIEYNHITLVDPLVTNMIELGKNDLLPAPRILRSEVWAFVDRGRIPSAVDGPDRSYLSGILSNPELYSSLKESASSVRQEAGGLLLRILESDLLMSILGLLLAIAALVLFIIRFTQGISRTNLRRFYIPLGVLGISILSSVAVHMTFSFKYHQIARVTAFINPDKFPRDLAYQIRASKAAIGSGQLVGRGLFAGDMTVGDRPLVPEAYTDFIFTSWSERTGFFGAIVLLALLIVIPVRALQLSFESRDRFASLLAAGIAFMFFFHILFNVGIALGLMPVTGLPLSFMSYGGSHLMICMAALGILLSIYRRRFAN
ncbi:MAG: rod shape-determining protein RodA [Spirochaetia bacterium]|nr:rod shape-determining protein RodA [Spirochaetia bacterium]